ncbi:efflux RND transporter periplasmic adaptor subunit [Candidatus Desulfovibrio trichonymphae]|uniref:Cation efflux system protein CusB n=1 Tax=Candidatus Desulfovibrio trichonymphae TaxID=1725232 RepID=A0A1J1DSF6_9BACT|nr:efflux RND transporter periplasmic adaptor subunit [Candidatus Desulfovibrio trichonymphae]BAV91565.1 cation efflux system protein CusB [Candidatus Desulfovibrio trichonymphae]GHU97046.1 metal RND transporter [Deltaproteobacteria bacterium]
MSPKSILLFLTCLSVGAVLGYGLAGPHKTTDAISGAAQKEEEAQERKVLYWYDPMYPGTHFDKPGKSPFMDMDLVPRYADGGDGTGIRIDPAQVQNLGVRTATVQRGALSFARDIPANVEYNDYQLAKVQPRAEGFVETIRSFAVGNLIQRGEVLAEITVPAWASDQSEYLLLKSQQADAQIVSGVRERMRLTGMPEEMLAAVDKTGRVQTRMMLKAPVAGVITGLDVYPGMNVNKNMTIATIQGTNPVWVTADVPESDIHLVSGRSRIRVTVQAYPEKVFHADSFTLLSKADQATRTVPLRVSVANEEGMLRPGMTAYIRLRASGEEALLIPTQSLIDLGDEQRVVTRASDGSFVPKLVRVLRSSGEMTAIASGVEAGDEVVVSGIFLIDSEANLRAALGRMRKNAASGAAEHAGH